MPTHSIGSGIISFGLVAIPVRLYTAAVSAGVSFRLLHATCGTRIRQQTYCPVDHAVVERGELELAVRLIDELSHAEFTPGQYRDDYRRRILDLVTLKGEGKAVPPGGPEVPRIRVIDLMDALTQSLAQHTAPTAPPGTPPAPMRKKPPVKVGTRAPAATPGRLGRRPHASEKWRRPSALARGQRTTRRMIP